MSDAFKEFLAKREAEQHSRDGAQRWFWVAIVVAVIVVMAIILLRGDPSTKILNPNTATAEELVTLPEVGPNMADAIIAKSSVAVATGKGMFYRQVEMGMADAYDYAANVMACNMQADDALEGLSAFIEKRQPVWKGR